MSVEPDYARAGYTRVPIWRQVSADLDTPLSVYLKLVDGPNSYLLESVQGGERWGRYSIIGLPARIEYQVHGHRLTVRDQSQVVAERTVADPLAEVERIRRAYRVPQLAGLPPFSGGLVGYFGFESVAYIEPRLQLQPGPDPLTQADIRLLLSEEIAVFDNLAGQLYLIVLADPSQPQYRAKAERRLHQLTHRLRQPAPGYPEPRSLTALAESAFSSGFSESAFVAAVDRCGEWIRAGDAFQIVLSQRMSVPFAARPLDVYRALRTLNPSPYMYFFDFGDLQIAGASPEILLRVDHGRMTLRPIAGTRPRGTTDEADRALAVELLADSKERAEHLMLIDLARNDLGRVCVAGTVTVNEQMVIERYSHVMHIVSDVSGQLRPGLGPLDAFRAAFPAGTLSGAPKVRAIEIIQTLEPVKRGIYGGAVGYLDWQGNADLAIAIRTALICAGQLHVQVGAGIVYDSQPAAEWAETLNKARAVFRAVERATGG